MRVLDQASEETDVGGLPSRGAGTPRGLLRAVGPANGRAGTGGLSEHPDLQCTPQQVELSLAEVLVAQGNAAAARQALQAWRNRGASHPPEDLPRAHIVLVDVAEADGDQRAARHAARGALQAVDLPAPYLQLPPSGVAHLASILHRIGD